MQTLRVEVEGRTLTFDGTRNLTIGRAAGSDIPLGAMSVSRVHAELRPTPGGWVLVDAGGQLGTYVDGHRVNEMALSGVTSVQCGPPGDGSSLVITVEQAPGAPPGPSYPPPTEQQFAPPTGPSAPDPQWAPPSAAPSPAPISDGLGFEPTYILASPLPGNFSGEMRPRSGPDLMIDVEGTEYRFQHPDPVTIGRLPDSSIVISDPVCSRMHLRVDPTAGGWGFTNLSREGTFIDGRRVESQTFDETVTVRLGHPSAGTELELVPVFSSQEEQSRAAKRRFGKRLKLLGAAAAALVLVLGIVGISFLVASDDGGDDDPTPAADSLATLTKDELDGAKIGAVLIVAESTDISGEEVQYSGSGTILTPEGLILTNAHVAEPEAEGLSDIYGPSEISDPEYLTIGTLSGPEARATFEYRARVVETDGNKDIAVIQIYADADGNEIDTSELDLPTVEVGDSDDMSTGDPITVLGFPGIANLGGSNVPEVTVTNGVISTFLDTERLGERSEIDTAARIAPGNSGGMAVNNDGQIIGVPSAYSRADETSPIVSGRIRPINIVKDVIEEAESATE